MRSVAGARRSAGFVATAPLADRFLQLPSWSALILAAYDYFLAAVAAHAGDTGELGARSAKARTIIGSLPWPSRERNIFVSTTASPAAPISKPIMGREASPSFWRIGLRFTST